MKAWVHIGQEMVGKVWLAPCCQNCKHCRRITPCDDPTQYACARLSRPKREPPVVFGRGSDTYRRACAEVHLWWARHYVAAGTTCNHFVPSTIPTEIIQYEDDYTREAAK